MTQPLSQTWAETVRQWADAARYLVELSRSPAPPPAPGRRILVVTRGLPPRFHGGTFRQLALLRALVKAGWAVDALTDTPVGSPGTAGLVLMGRVPDGIRIYRWSAPARQASWRFSPRLSGGFGTIRRLLDAAREIEDRPSMVLASGPPFAEFVAARLLARAWRVPCVLDYRDEWSTSQLAFVDQGGSDARWEERCLARAAAAVFTTDATTRHYLATFPTLRDRVTATIRNGWDDTGAFARGEAPPAPAPSAPVVVGFFGLLGEHWDFDEFARTLGTLLAAEPALASRVVLDFYGTVSRENAAVIAELRQPAMFRLHGLVPHDQAQRAMMSCDALIVFNNQRLARVLPGKIFEYIASRRPILLYGDGGEMASLLRGIPGTVVVPRGDATGLGAAFRRIAAGDLAAVISSSPGDYPAAFHRQHRDREWIRLLEAMLPPGTD